MWTIHRWAMVIALWPLGVASTLAAEPSSCTTLFERGVERIEGRPRLHAGDLDATTGRPATEKAKRYEMETNAVLELWERARKACLDEAGRALEFREAARWTAWSYRIEGRSLRVRGENIAECETYREGIEVVEAIERRSPHVAMLYDLLGLCVADRDGAQGAALIEEGLEIAIAAHGARDARVVDHMIHLAVVLPYSVAPHGDLSNASGPEAQAAAQRIAELRRSAWEIVQEDPNATAEQIRRAAASFRTWQASHGEDESVTRQIEAELIARRESSADS